ncbi:FAD/NAD(P)-binding oxidoreductase [Nocardioides panacihumi]|uniref:FAD/NAD(P)-binding oxidoreductase n=1 Tax=Nocardioides panacihumi TaxID=400774 RepID=A0ABN2RN81_9ACTN
MGDVAAGDGHVVVVGASLGGLRAAEQLRAAGHVGPVTVVGEEPWAPYNRPPLSKEILADEGDDDAERLHARLAFRRRASVGDVEFVLGRRAVASDLGARTVTLDDGTVVPWDGLVVATGLRARRLPVPGPQAGRHVVRTLADACGLRGAVRRHGAAVVIGGGFVGCETAASLHKLGLDVTVVLPERVAFERALGAELGGAVQRHLEAAGIRFVTGASIAAYTGDDEVDGVTLGDGTSLVAGLVVEAVGSQCNTEWLAGNGLDLSDGVLCDNDLRVVGAEWTVAVGDVARFPNPLVDATPRRVEHWSMPTDTAKRAAASLVADLGGVAAGPLEPFAPTPSFWSDLLDLRLQAYGSPSLGDEVELEEGDLGRLADGVVLSHLRDGRLVGTVAVNLAPARLRPLRDRFAAPALTH